MQIKSILCSCMLVLFSTGIMADVSQKINFKSTDELLVTADIYAPHKPVSPVIVLFHQAGSSRGEYNEIAPRLNKLGFNCIAVDLRSGEFSRGKDNMTSMRASNAGLATRYADALPDIISALKYTHNKYPNAQVLGWGSSYSAALVLKVAGDYPQLMDAVLAFSPGEYFSHQGKSKSWIKDSARNINIPVFISSARNEADSWEPIMNVIPSNKKTGFLPSTEGRHGSRALWKKYNDSDAYWKAVEAFLNQVVK